MLRFFQRLLNRKGAENVEKELIQQRNELSSKIDMLAYEIHNKFMYPNERLEAIEKLQALQREVAKIQDQLKQIDNERRKESAIKTLKTDHMFKYVKVEITDVGSTTPCGTLTIDENLKVRGKLPNCEHEIDVSILDLLKLIDLEYLLRGATVEAFYACKQPHARPLTSTWRGASYRIMFSK